MVNDMEDRYNKNSFEFQVTVDLNDCRFILYSLRLRWFGHVKCRDENRKLKRAMELEVEGRTPKKT